MIRVSEWRNCKDCPPEHSGKYLVMRLYNGELSFAMCVEYIFAYGWNCRRNSDGSIDVSHRVELDTAYLWAEIREV